MRYDMYNRDELEIMLERQRPVIKAVRTLTDVCETGNALERDVALAAVFLTVEALERAEKEARNAKDK
jgi:hypothetical protein